MDLSTGSSDSDSEARSDASSDNSDRASASGESSTDGMTSTDGMASESSTDGDGSSDSSSSEGVEDQSASAPEDDAAEDGEPERDHLEHCILGAKCSRCRWIANRANWKRKLTCDVSGESVVWIEERVGIGKPWGLGCKVCRWAGISSKFARGEVTGDRMTALYQLQRHGNHVGEKRSQGHARALRKLTQKSENEEKTSSTITATTLCRSDVPSLPMFYSAYQGAKSGHSFQTHTRNCELLELAGAPIHKERRSRFVVRFPLGCWVWPLLALFTIRPCPRPCGPKKCVCECLRKNFELLGDVGLQTHWIHMD